VGVLFLVYFFSAMDVLEESDGDEDDVNSEFDEDVDCSVVDGGHEIVGMFPFLSLSEFTRVISKRAAMVSQGAAPCIPNTSVNAIVSELRKRQNGELLHLSESIALAEWLQKRLPMKVTTMNRSLDPNTSELAFRPLRDHVLCKKLAWLWDLFCNENS